METDEKLEIYRSKITDLIIKNIDLRRDMEEVLRSDERKQQRIGKLLEDLYELELKLQGFRTHSDP